MLDIPAPSADCGCYEPLPIFALKSTFDVPAKATISVPRYGPGRRGTNISRPHLYSWPRRKDPLRFASHCTSAMSAIHWWSDRPAPENPCCWR